jgi:hypothetical protein
VACPLGSMGLGLVLAQALEQLRGSVLRFDDPCAPVCENDWEVEQKEKDQR